MSSKKRKKRVSLKEKAFREVIKRPGITSAQLSKTLKTKTSAGTLLYDYIKKGLIVREYPVKGNKQIVRYYPSKYGLDKIQKTEPKILDDLTDEVGIKEVELNIDGEKQTHWEVAGVFYTDKKKAEDRLRKQTIEELGKMIPVYQRRIKELEEEYEISKTFFEKMASLVGLSKKDDETFYDYFNRLERTIERVVREKEDYFRELKEIRANQTKEDHLRYERGSYR